MAIPTGVILIWTGTNASIPSGWERETTLDDKFPKAWGDENPNVANGSDTHTHTGNHTHTLTAHSHSCSYGYASTANIDDNSGNVIRAHNHSTSNINGTSGGGLQSTTVTWSSADCKPPYYAVIFIKPSGAPANISTGILSHYTGDSLPTNWNWCDGNNGTPNLTDKYLRGAGTGGDAGGTGGVTSHQHTISHTHTASSHSHSGTTGAVANSSGGRANGGAPEYEAHTTHTHAVTLASTTLSINAYTKTDAGSGDTVEVANIKVGTLKAAANAIRYKGLIGLWLGSTNDIPSNWSLCDGNNETVNLKDRFIKTTNTTGEFGDISGANTHIHANISHTHTQTATHNHTGSMGGASATQKKYGGSQDACYATHTHVVTVGNANVTYSSTNITADTVDNQPAYRTAAYIELMKVGYGGSFLLNFV